MKYKLIVRTIQKLFKNYTMMSYEYYDRRIIRITESSKLRKISYRIIQFVKYFLISFDFRGWGRPHISWYHNKKLSNSNFKYFFVCFSMNWFLILISDIFMHGQVADVFVYTGLSKWITNIKAFFYRIYDIRNNFFWVFKSYFNSLFSYFNIHYTLLMSY